jgi:hypothetical protein
MRRISVSLETNCQNFWKLKSGFEIGRPNPEKGYRARLLLLPYFPFFYFGTKYFPFFVTHHSSLVTSICSSVQQQFTVNSSQRRMFFRNFFLDVGCWLVEKLCKILRWNARLDNSSTSSSASRANLKLVDQRRQDRVKLPT